MRILGVSENTGLFVEYTKESMKNFKFWFWWYFKASEIQKMMVSFNLTGSAYKKNGKVIYPFRILKGNI